jgi:GntR family transcriptional regulator, galactonate operon transcriptional repressor
MGTIWTQVRASNYMITSSLKRFQRTYVVIWRRGRDLGCQRRLLPVRNSLEGEHNLLGLTSRDRGSPLLDYCMICMINQVLFMSISSTLCSQVTERLGIPIVRGEFGPSGTLPTEAQLCEQFEVSRTVVREAMKVLSAKGLIEARPKRGTRICSRERWNALDPEILQWTEKCPPFYEDLAEVRRMIEPAVAELAAIRATGENVRELGAACQRMAEAERLGQSEEYNRADFCFHAELAKSCGNWLLTTVFQLINPLINVNREATVGLLAKVPSVVPIHRELVAAVQGRDPTRARAAMETIVERAREYAKPSSLLNARPRRVNSPHASMSGRR